MAERAQTTTRIIAATIGASLLGFGLWGDWPSKRRAREAGSEVSPAAPAGDTSDPHGRKADSPASLPLPSWKDILTRTYSEISDDRLLAVAAGVTFYSLLAIFPAIAAFVSLYGLFADPATLSEHLGMLSGVLPAGGLEIVGEQLARITSQENGTLSFAFLIGLATALWSANAGVKALFDALNVIYDERENRSFLKLNLLSLTFTIGAILFLALGLIAVAVVPVTLDYLGLRSMTERLVALLRWPALFMVSMVGLSVLFRYGPSRARAQWRWVSLGSTVAAALWIGASFLFSWYVSNFGSYNETYGSLGAAIGFMIWIWISIAIVLAGAELNAEAEHQTARDSTTGRVRPMGSRGAVMADTLGDVQR